MSTTQQAGLTVAELERLIKEFEPAALLAPPRLLRRIIKQDCEIGGFGLKVPHRKGYVIERAALERLVGLSELGAAPDAELPSHVFLLAQPNAARLAKTGRASALAKYQRMLFHLHIDRAMQLKLANGTLTPTMVRERIKKLGLTEFAEITDVLRQDDYLLPPESPETVYAEFAAVYLTMRHFVPARLPHFFPALRDLAAVDAILAEDIDAAAICRATRLGEEDNETGRQGDKETETSNPSAPLSPCLPVSLSGALEELSERLTKSLELSEDDAERWRAALMPVFAQSAEGVWNQEARLLSDLQTLCVDSEHGVYAVDLMGWVLSLGELPVKRPLPAQQEVVMVRRLRGLLDRLRWVRLSDSQRQQLNELLKHAVEQREFRMRERFRPLIEAVFDEVELKPTNVAESIGRAKLIEELLDRVVENGHFNIGNLRDAISRNQLKLPDLTGPGELVRGDPLIRLNRRLAVSLDGVYRRGEFYMRLLHRLNSAFFGTMIGRLLVLFLILPFGLAFFVMITPGIAVEEGEKLVHFIGRLTGLMEKPAEAHNQSAGHGLTMPDPWGVLGFGIFFVLLFNVASFRNRFFSGLGWLGRGVKRVHADAVWLLQTPGVQALLHNRYWRVFRRFVLWPALLASAAGLFAWWYDQDLAVIAGAAASGMILGILLLGTPVGRDLEEVGTDWLLNFWVWLTIDFIPGLLRLTMDFSRRCLDAFEQLFYTVNQWLRFRGGDNRLVVVVKAILGLFWYAVTYVLRFAINLLIEPQINPIKHFPVVTVSHKVCLPMIPTLADFLRSTGAVSRPTTTATGIIFGIPGIFGFMVWELKENWKLYASNRAADLKPVLIGSHGETMLRLLHPGFHSGTVPKLYRKLRRAERHEPAGSAAGPTVRKLTAALHHVEESVAHFVERELVALLRQSKSWGGLDIELASIHLATNRVLVELSCPSLGEEPLRIAIDHQNGWLLAGVMEEGWLPRLNGEQRQALASALAGLYKMAGVDATREQIVANLPASTFAYSISEAGLLVWSTADSARDAVYDLSAGPELPPRPLNGAMPAELPVLDADRLLFGNVPLPWIDWVRACEGESTRLADSVVPAISEPEA